MISYASLDEVWGDMKKKKRSKSTPPADPVCELYNMGSNSYDAQTSLVELSNQKFMSSPPPQQKPASFSDNLFEKQFELRGIHEPTQQPQHPQHPQHPQQPHLQQPSKPVNVTQEDPYLEDLVRKKIAQVKAENAYVRQERPFHSQNNYYSKEPHHTPYIDIAMYIISGIILIFLLEQFVQIGINMQMY
jgi:hypothetical protein